MRKRQATHSDTPCECKRGGSDCEHSDDCPNVGTSTIMMLTFEGGEVACRWLCDACAEVYLNHEQFDAVPID